MEWTSRRTVISGAVFFDRTAAIIWLLSIATDGLPEFLLKPIERTLLFVEVRFRLGTCGAPFNG